MGPLVDERTLARLLDDVAAGTTPVADAVEALRTLPYESVTDAQVDHHRELWTGYPEAIYGPGRSDVPAATTATVAWITWSADFTTTSRARS